MTRQRIDASPFADLRKERAGLERRVHGHQTVFDCVAQQAGKTPDDILDRFRCEASPGQSVARPFTRSRVMA